MKGNQSYQLTEDLRVRPISEEDTEMIVEWRNRDFVRRNFIFREPFTVQMHRNWMTTKVAPGLVEQFIIEYRMQEKGDNGNLKETAAGPFTPVGSVYLRDVDYVYKQAEYGIFLGEEGAYGKGIGNRAARWAVWYAKEELQLDTMILRVFADNERALKSYRQAGFEPVETIKDFFVDGDKHRDLVFMKIDLKEK